MIPVIAAVVLSVVAHVRTDFSIDSIKAPLQENGAAVSLPILNQTFTFLGSGRQSFAFIGEDGTTVLKFFNKKYFEMPWYCFALWNKEEEKKKRTRRAFFYAESYFVAEKFLQEQTGIMYLHLSKSEGLPIVRVIDRASREFEVDLNSVPFVVQRKCEPLYSALANIQKTQGNQALVSTLNDFLEMVDFRISKGIADSDHDVEHNFGFLEGKLVHLDPGRLFLCDFSEKSRVSHEWWSATHSLRKWLVKEYPEVVDAFDKALAIKTGGV